MKNKIYLKKTGLPLVDVVWGGFYNGGSYLMVGKRKSGKTIAALQFAKECVEQDEKCLFFTDIRPKDLLIFAASIDFDLDAYMNDNKVIVIKVFPPEGVFETENPDELLIDYFNDILNIIDEFKPDKLIFDELTPFIGFKDNERLGQVFMKNKDEIENRNITSLYVIREPASPLSEEIVNTLIERSTGVIYLKKEIEESSGEIIITPVIGHPEGKQKSNYYIEPYKGIATDNKKLHKN